MRRFGLLLGVSIFLVIAACEPDAGPTTTMVSPTTANPTPSGVGLDEVRRATVQILAGSRSGDGEVVITGTGSGGIIDSSGLILTNAHVAAPEAPGLERLYALSIGKSTPERINPDVLVIGMFVSEDREPDFRYLAEVVVADGSLDLAVLQIVSDITGDPVFDLDLPALQIGDSDKLSGGDDLTVFGYPGVGGSTITTTRGIVSGFAPDDRVEDLNRGWVKTDTAINPGNSGGVAVDEGMRLVGVPTRGGDGIDQLRPINIAKQLIADALAGQSYVRGTGVVSGTDRETFELKGWGTERPEGQCLSDLADRIASGPRRIFAAFEFDGFTTGEDLVWYWFIGSELWYSQGLTMSEGWTFDESGACFTIPGAFTDERLLPDGSYSIVVYTGENLHKIAEETVAVGGQEAGPDGITIIGELVDADTEIPIANQVIGFLNPGTDVSSWAQNPDAESIFTAGRTDADGRVEFTKKLQPDVQYPWFILTADLPEYPSPVRCCYELPDDAANPFTLTFSVSKVGS